MNTNHRSKRLLSLLLALCMMLGVMPTAFAHAEGEEDTYYYDAVLWAIENGITNGTSADSFSPNARCTRAQIVTFLFRCMAE